MKAVNADVSLSGNGGGVGGVRKLVQVEGSGEAIKMGEVSLCYGMLSRSLIC